MPRRYIGDAVVTITYQGGDLYTGVVRRFGTDLIWRFGDLHCPPAGFGPGIAYDSPRAYDKMACAAVGFATYYTTHNRGEDTPDWAPSAEVADALSEATVIAMDDRGCYSVRRSENGPERYRGE